MDRPPEWPIALYLTTPGSRFWTAAAGLGLEDAFARAAALGFDAVEIMPRALDDPDPDMLKTLSDRSRLPIQSLASGFLAVDHGLTFTHPDPAVRREAVAAMCGCINMATVIGAPLVSIGVIRGKVQHDITHAEAMEALVACVWECGARAQAVGVTLVLEPGNRYETDFIHTIGEGLDLIAAVNLPSVRLMLDTFHMNIEEPSIADAFRRAGPHLAHVHFADSNRRAPGWGHLDFVAVVRAMREVGYRGAIGLEMSLAPDFEAAAWQGLRFVRDLLRTRS